MRMQELRLLQGAWNDLMRMVCEDVWLRLGSGDLISTVLYLLQYCNGKRASLYPACQADSSEVAWEGYSAACR